MPPALATKSGAQRISRSASCDGDRVGGELVVGRAGDRRGSAAAGTVSSSSTPPSAHGASTSTSAVSAASGSVQRGAELVGERALAVVDVGDARARRPASASSRASLPPTRPSPTTATRAAGQRRSCRTRARRRPRIAHWTPSAVHGLGSPEPPRLDGQAGDVVGRLGDHRHVAVGGADVLGGHVARRRARRPCRRSPAARRGARRPRAAACPAGSMITPLPPPSGSPATADLKVIARDRRSASRTAARASP